METFFLYLLSLSAGGCIMAGLLLLLRRGAKNRLPRSFYYYAWLLVLLRMALPLPGFVPVELPETPAAVQVEQPVETLPQTEDEIALPLETNPQSPVWQEAPPPLPQLVPVSRTPQRLQTPRLSAGQWLFLLWAAGAVACLGRDLTGYFRFRKLLAGTCRPARGEDLSIYDDLTGERRPRLLRSPAIDTPILIGLTHPVLVLPDREYAPETLNCIFRHELTHFDRGDILYKWFAAFVLSVHWFNPLGIFLRREIDRCCELSCDERILKTMDHDQRKHYGETLLVMASRSAPSRTVLATSFSTEKKNLKERLVHIMNFRPKSKWILCITAVLLIAVGGLCMLLGPARKTADLPESEPDQLLTIPKEDVSKTVTGAPEQSFLSMGFAGENAFTYRGGEITVPCNLAASRDIWGEGMGLLLLLGGEPQPYKISENGELKYLHTFDAPIQKTIDLIFTPVTGQAGDTLDLTLINVRNASRYVSNSAVPFDHTAGSTMAFGRLTFEAAPPAAPAPVLGPQYPVAATVSFEDRSYSGSGRMNSSIVKSANTLSLRYSILSPETARYSLVVYLNNLPVGPAISFSAKAMQEAKVDMTIDLSNFGGAGMVYAVLYSPDWQEISTDYVPQITETYYMTAESASAAHRLPGNDVNTNVVMVETVDEFLAAIGPNTTIVLKNGAYDLSTASNYGERETSEYYHWVDGQDGHELSIDNVHNLHIVGAGEEKAMLIASAKYGSILRFHNCQDFSLRNIYGFNGKLFDANYEEAIDETMRNQLSALYFNHCSSGVIENCEFQGSECYAVEAKESKDISFQRTEFYNCREDLFNLMDCENVQQSVWSPQGTATIETE